MNESEAKQVIQCVRENFPTSKLRTPEVEVELMRRLMGLRGVDARQAMVCIRDYRFTEKGFQPQTLWKRLADLGREAKAKGGQGDPNDWPLWRKYQAWMSRKMPAGAEEPTSPLGWIAFWHRCLMHKYAPQKGQQEAANQAACGFVHDLLREGMVSSVEEAIALAEQHVAAPDERTGAWLLEKHGRREVGAA